MYAQSRPTLGDPIDCSPLGSSVHGISQQEYQNGCHLLLQGIFLTQESNPSLLCLLHGQANSLPPCHLGSTCSLKETTLISIHYLLKCFLKQSCPLPDQPDLHERLCGLRSHEAPVCDRRSHTCHAASGQLRTTVRETCKIPREI